MLNHLLIIWLWLVTSPTLAQTIEITYQQIRNDAKPIILQNTIGQLTLDHSLRLGNRTDAAVQIQLQTYTTFPFIYFLNQFGDYEHTVRFWLPPQTKFAVPLLVYTRQGKAKIYEDKVKVTITLLKSQQVIGAIFTDVNLTTYFSNPAKKRRNEVLQKRGVYEVFRPMGLPIRFDTAD